jgi:hypothetical protein
MKTTSFRNPAATCIVVLGALLGGCASTSLVNQWKSPDYAGGPMRKIMVVGVAKQPSVRRVFEDEFVTKLKAAGVEGIPSYTVIPEDGQAEQAQLEAAVQKAGADGVLVTRLVKKEKDTQVTGGYAAPMAPIGMYGWYSSAWTGYYEPATVYQYDVLTLETSLYSPQQSKLVWSGTTQTFDPSDVKQETAGFADLIIGTLRKEKII